MSIKRILFSRTPASLWRLLPARLRRKWLPLPVRNELRIRGALRGGRRVVFVSSYPRSGNTWLRKLMADLMLQKNGRETDTSLPIHHDRLIPDRDFNPIPGRLPLEAMPGLPVKTHDPFPAVSRLYPSGRGPQVRHVYIYRDPADALVSYYHFHLRYEKLKAKLDGMSVDDFCLRHTGDWKAHLQSYLAAQEGGERVYLLSYEQLSADAVPPLLSLFGWLDYPVTRGQAERAVEHHRFRKLREKEAKDPINEKEFFFRKGKVGGGREELREETISRIREECGGLISRAETRVNTRTGGLTPDKGPS